MIQVFYHRKVEYPLSAANTLLNSHHRRTAPSPLGIQPNLGFHGYVCDVAVKDRTN